MSALTSAAGWRRRLAHSTLMIVSFAVPVVASMADDYAVTGHFAITQRAYPCYGRTAAADCATLEIPPYERALCPPPVMAAEFGIDWIITNPQGPLLSYRPPPGTTTQAAATRFEHAVLTQQPAALPRAVTGPMWPWHVRAC